MRFMYQDLGGTFQFFACDTSDEKSVNEAFAAIVAKLGHPDVLVFNASGPYKSDG